MITLSARVVAIGSGLVLTGLALAIREKIYEVIMFLPVLMFSLCFYYLNLHTAVREMGGYKRYIEERINEIVGEQIYLWESELVHRRHSNVANQFMAGIFFFILIASVAAALFVSYTYKHKWVLYAEIIAIVLLGFGCVLATVRMTTSFEKTYCDAKQIGATTNKANAADG